MSPRLKELEAAASTLPTADRAAMEQMWVRESERRYEAYKADKITARPAADAIRDARARLR